MLDRQFVIDDRHHDIPMARLPRPDPHQHIPIENAGRVMDSPVTRT
ncbi:MAG: hypothetical protein WBJ41_02315 [Chromatiaceae bacterium]